MSWIIDPLPFDTDALNWFTRLAGRPGRVLLESGGCADQRYDIVAADPAVTLRATGTFTTVDGADGVHTDPFDRLAALIEARRPGSPCPLDADFTGGAIGYFGYELGGAVETLPPPTGDDIGMPDMAVGMYDSFILVDHERRQTLLVSSPHVSGAAHKELKASLDRPAHRAGSFRAGPVEANLSQQEYKGAIEKIGRYIEDGDCYQVNLAQRFNARFEGDPVALYRAIRHDHPAPYSACLEFGDHRVFSFSPERFLRVRGNHVTTEPIKGTRRRDASAPEDSRLAAELLASAKDRAENLMIVDLLRNDLGRCCEPGSIAVEALFELRSTPNVHHLVSTVTGRLRRDQTALSLLRACFPGGSITGAPKVRAMEIINELEPSRRHAYCGAIGYCGYDGNMDTNVAIRTLVCSRDRVYFWGGGGIVADSTAASEYAESIDKVSMIRRALDAARTPSAIV